MQMRQVLTPSQSPKHTSLHINRSVSHTFEIQALKVRTSFLLIYVYVLGSYPFAFFKAI